MIVTNPDNRENAGALDGRLFANERGDVLGTSSYWRV